MTTLIGKLFEAMKSFPKFEKNGRNTYYKSDKYPQGSPHMIYEDILDGVNPVLWSNGLYLEHVEAWEDCTYFVGTRLVCVETGEKGEPFLMPVPHSEAQKTSAGITYAKRVTLCGLLALAGEADEDGNDALSKPPVQRHSQATMPAGEQRTFDGPSEKQLKRLFAIASSKGVMISMVDALIKSKFNTSKSKLDRDQYNYICGLMESGNFKDEFHKYYPPESVGEELPF